MLSHQPAGGRVLVLEPAGVAHRGEEKVMRQKLEAGGIDVFLQHLKLCPLVVIDVNMPAKSHPVRVAGCQTKAGSGDKR